MNQNKNLIVKIVLYVFIITFIFLFISIGNSLNKANKPIPLKKQNIEETLLEEWYIDFDKEKGLRYSIPILKVIKDDYFNKWELNVLKVFEYNIEDSLDYYVKQSPKIDGTTNLRVTAPIFAYLGVENILLQRTSIVFSEVFVEFLQQVAIYLNIYTLTALLLLLGFKKAFKGLFYIILNYIKGSISMKLKWCNKSKIKKIEEDYKVPLLTPVYLRSDVILDMIASIEDGFYITSTENIINESENKENQKGVLGFKFGSPILNEHGTAEENKEILIKQGTNISKEKTQTMGSLFIKLYTYLNKNNKIRKLEENVVAGDIVEITSSFKKSSVIYLVESLIDLLQLYVDLIDNFTISNNKQNVKNKIKQNNVVTNNSNETTIKQITKAIDVLKYLKTQLNIDETVDLLSKDDLGYSILLPVDSKYMYNTSINMLLDGEYKILGKVMKVNIEDDSEISLVRNTVINFIYDMLKNQVETKTVVELIPMLDSLNEVIDGLESAGLNSITERIKEGWSIWGKSYIIIPYAIYL